MYDGAFLQKYLTAAKASSSVLIEYGFVCWDELIVGHCNWTGLLRSKKVANKKTKWKLVAQKDIRLEVQAFIEKGLPKK